jgi:hypothetical protein
MTPRARGLLILAAWGCCAGCSSTLRFDQISPERQAMSAGTQPGRHLLSPWFTVEVRKSTLDQPRAAFYHTPDRSAPDQLVKLGEQYVYWPTGEYVTDKQEFGPRRCSYAISADGRALLYFVEPSVPFSMPHQDWEPRPFGASLHLYRVGLGDSLIAEDVTHHVDVYGLEVPGDAVVYYLPDKPMAARGTWNLGAAVVRSCSEFRGGAPGRERVTRAAL